ncbi:MAG: hypothetical protein H8D46_01740 [FCB group bacterium]|nr:hypothetical protein [FCB group bacterium]
MHNRKIALIGVILLTALTRFIPHPPNFTPVIAMGLFGGAYFSDKKFALLVPLLAMFLTDLFLGLHMTMAWVYAALILVVLMGFLLQGRIRFSTILGGSLGGALVFFLLTNLGVWMTGTGYHHPHTFAGLMAVYADGIPFFGNTLAGSLIYATVLFAGFETVQRLVPELQLDPVRK